MTQTASLPPGRYGAPASPRRRRLLLGGLALALLAGLAGVLWLAVQQARIPVHWQDVDYQVLDAGQVRVRFDVTKSGSASVRCVVRALDAGFTEVGSRAVEIGPASTSTVRTTVVVRTTSLAVNGGVRSCSLLP